MSERFISIDIGSLNELELDGIRALAKRYPHGWSTGDLVVRKDAIEKRYQADWVGTVARQIAAALETQP